MSLLMIMTIVTTDAGDRREQSSSMPVGNRGTQFGRFSGYVTFGLFYLANQVTFNDICVVVTVFQVYPTRVMKCLTRIRKL